MAKSWPYGKRVRLYPLSQADNPPETVFVDAADVVFEISTIKYNASFFEILNSTASSRTNLRIPGIL